MPNSEKTEAIEFVGALLTDIALLEAAIAILDRVKVEDAAEDAKHMIEMCRRRVTMMRTAYVRACNAVR